MRKSERQDRKKTVTYSIDGIDGVKFTIHAFGSSLALDFVCVFPVFPSHFFCSLCCLFFCVYISIFIFVEFTFQYCLWLHITLDTPHSLSSASAVYICYFVFLLMNERMLFICSLCFVCILCDGWLSTLYIHLSSAKMIQCNESFIFVFQ